MRTSAGPGWGCGGRDRVGEICEPGEGRRRGAGAVEYLAVEEFPAAAELQVDRQFRWRTRGHRYPRRSDGVRCGERRRKIRRDSRPCVRSVDRSEERRVGKEC